MLDTNPLYEVKFRMCVNDPRQVRELIEGEGLQRDQARHPNQFTIRTYVVAWKIEEIPGLLKNWFAADYERCVIEILSVFLLGEVLQRED